MSGYGVKEWSGEHRQIWQSNPSSRTAEWHHPKAATINPIVGQCNIADSLLPEDLTEPLQSNVRAVDKQGLWAAMSR
jgi:hypothetical protein